MMSYNLIDEDDYVDEVEECFCMDELNNYENGISIRLPCKHAVHINCILQHSETRPIPTLCPYCRSDIIPYNGSYTQESVLDYLTNFNVQITNNRVVFPATTTFKLFSTDGLNRRKSMRTSNIQKSRRKSNRRKSIRTSNRRKSIRTSNRRKSNRRRYTY